MNYTDYVTHRLYDGLVTEKMVNDYLLNLSPELGQVYRIVNRLQFALGSHYFDWVLHHLEERKQVTLPRKVRASMQTLERLQIAIGNSCTYTRSNGAIEGLNNKIRTIKRTGYGYRNFNHLRSHILNCSHLAKDTF